MGRPNLRAGVVSTISYRCREIGYGVEEAIIDAFWTGEVDHWGKYTIRPLDGGRPIYLFADEIQWAEQLISVKPPQRR